jgi:23S rRNA (uracil1939-C5)-methyltransferase
VVVLVPGALPDELVEVRITEEKKDFARATVISVIEASPDRIEPPCPAVALGCGGCDWQHAAVGAQRTMQEAIVADVWRRVRGLEGAVPAIASVALPATAYRTTVRGVVADGRFALRRRHGHDAVAIGSCLVLDPLVDELVRGSRFADATEVTLRVGARTGERLAVVAPDVAGVVVPTGCAVVGADELAAGKRAWIHEEAAGRRWRLSVGSFFQAGPLAAEALVAAVADAAGPIAAGEHLVDAYGGVGLFAGAIGGPAGARVTLIERSASSVADARINLADLDARIVRADVDRWRASAADLVIADPSRAGLGRTAVARLTAAGPRRLVLVSCDPAALGRDAGLLLAAGYRPTASTLVDDFPQPSHIEVVTAFDPVARLG